MPSERILAGDHDDPVWAGDQDALNALLMSEIPQQGIALLPRREEAFPEDLRSVSVVDARTLSCTREGRPVTILHHGMRPKPWDRGAWIRVRWDAYVRLMRRLLFANDVTIGVAPSQVPMWLRPGPFATLALLALDHAHDLASRMPLPMRARLWKRRDRMLRK